VVVVNVAKRTRSAAAAAAAPGPTAAALQPAAPTGVTFSTKDSAQQLGYSKGALEVTGAAGGYRMARATDGVFSGNWYWEAEVLLEEEEEDGAKGQEDGNEGGGGDEENVDGGQQQQPPPPPQQQQQQEDADSAPHFRLGWALRQADTQAPCGYDKNSYGYRDVDGARVHKSLREDGYGEAYGTRCIACVGLYFSVYVMVWSLG
jgi:hypothetical protein